jgi:hypothetical protein
LKFEFSLKPDENRKGIFLILNGYLAETELGPRAQRTFGLLRPSHSVEPA